MTPALRASEERHRHRPSQRQTELQQAKETVTEEDGPLAELHTGNETSYSGLLSASGSVFNALFMRLQSNSKQSGNRTEKVGVCVCVSWRCQLGDGGWGRMRESSQCFKTLSNSQSLRLYTEFGAVLSTEFKTRGVL